MLLFQPPLYFHCNQCGACCREFYIPLSHIDVLRLLVAYPEAAPEELFLLRPVDPPDIEALLLEGSFWHLMLQRREDACRFLLEDGRCGTYESRPRACRTFPFDQAPLGLLRILPDAQTVYRQRCDHARSDRVQRPMLKEAAGETRLGSREFSEYREMVARWNAWASAESPAERTLERFLAMIRSWSEL